VKLYRYFALALPLIVLYALYHHAEIGFSRFKSGTTVQPFFSDHAIYGAVLAMLLPFYLIRIFYHRFFETKSWKLIGIIIVFAILSAGFFFSFSRAAWLSIGAAAIFYLLLLLRLKPHYLTIIFLLAGLFLYL